MAKAEHASIPLADVERIDAADLFSISNTQRKAVRDARPRIIVMALGFILVYAVLVVRAIGLTVFSHQPVVVKKGTTPVVSLARAPIIDRNGRLLASTIETYSAHIARADVRDPARLAAQLSKIKGMVSEQRLRARLKGKAGTARLGYRLTPATREAIFALGIPGLTFKAEQTRFYPNGTFAAHLLGWVDGKGKGKAGAERAFQQKLTQQTDEALTLSIDTRIQFALEDELKKAMEEFRPLSALGIVTRVKTGEVLAMAGLPTFDPNAPGKVSYLERQNRAVVNPYELGSVFKPLTLAMGFDQGLITPDEMFDVVNPLIVNSREIKDMHKNWQKQSVREILVHSSNKGAAMIALKVGGVSQRDYLASFGLLDPAKVELRESQGPFMASRQWRPVKVATIGFGHGIMVTPLAFVQAIGALANGGKRVPLTLVARPKTYQPQSHKVVSLQAAKTVLGIMREVVTDGTGKKADVAGYDVAGKTGSAEKLDPKTGKYSKDRNISSFVAIFPEHDPQYLVFILLDEPKGDARTSGWETAGWNAAPVTGRLISRIGPVLMPKAGQRSVLASLAEKTR
jgi:cell division protein FtsI (penicillin-binding protein 3)